MKRLAQSLMLCSVAGFSTLTLAVSPAKSPDPKPSPFEKLVDEFFDNAYFKFNPTQGTAVGFHQYDAQLEDYTKDGVDKNIAALRSYRQKIEAAKPKASTIEVSDRELILHYIDAALLELEVI